MVLRRGSPASAARGDRKRSKTGDTNRANRDDRQRIRSPAQQTADRASPKRARSAGRSSFIVIFMAMNSILTKGVLRAGGDTKFLMIGDILFLWVASIPLGYLAGLVFHWSSFWIYTMLKLDQIIKCVWCYFRLRSGKWLKKINRAGE